MYDAGNESFLRILTSYTDHSPLSSIPFSQIPDSCYVWVETAFPNTRLYNEVSDIIDRPPGVSEFLKAQPEIQKFERKLLIQLHKDGSFNQAAIRRVEQELDPVELQLKRINKAKK